MMSMNDIQAFYAKLENNADHRCSIKYDQNLANKQENH